MATEKKYLIDNLDFSNVKKMIETHGGFAYAGMGSVSSAAPNIPAELIYVYICKNHIKTYKDVAHVIYNLNLVKNLTKENKEIVFSVFRNGTFEEMLNAIEKEYSTVSTWFDTKFGGHSLNEMLKQLKAFDQDTLQLFADVTGANEFINYVKKLREKDLAEIKRNEEIRKLDEDRRRQTEEKQRQEKEKRLEKRNEKITNRLIKLAEKFERGDFRYSMKLPFDRNISREDIAALPKNNPGVQAMFAALVHGQTKIKTVNDLKVFDEMLEYMRDQFAPRTCLHHVSLEQLLELGGLTLQDLEKPKKTAESIARYKKALDFIDAHRSVFEHGLGLVLNHYPHDERVNIKQYDTPEALNLLVKAENHQDIASGARAARRRMAEARVIGRATLKMKEKIHDKMSDYFFDKAYKK